MKFPHWFRLLLCASIIFSFQSSIFNSAHAQKYACVNTDFVLRSIPDYTNAQKRLEKYVEDWSAELSEKIAELEELRATFEQESYLLPDNLKQRRKEEIAEKEREVKQLQQQRFGAGGDLDKKQAELLGPVQDRVYNMIERVAQEKNYAFVFDKSAGSTVLFANKKYDISNDVLELLGVQPGQAQQGQAEGRGSGTDGKKADRPSPTNPELNRDPRSMRGDPASRQMPSRQGPELPRK